MFIVGIDQITCLHLGMRIQPLLIAGDIGIKLWPPVLKQQGQDGLQCDGDLIIGKPIGNVRCIFTVRCIGQLHTLHPTRNVGRSLLHQCGGVRVASKVCIHGRDETQVGNAHSPSHHIGVALKVNIKGFEQFFVSSLYGRHCRIRYSQRWQTGAEKIHDPFSSVTPCLAVCACIQSTSKLGLQEEFLLITVAPSIVHGGLQHACQTKAVDQPCHHPLHRCGRGHECL